ncbi:carboxypeptidase-like regulatory domain-containing protein [Hyalangium versicolor]|uniref:carboxypeptidase-like regulatory domain-containing protein n=1 Tax=Hyalangium versicolor TaxID=2861190 RepID=UPI001CCD5B03|nr:carboxypeptidase-like regulatory domain-containing protein [Hyalangium versicolor]
MPRPLRFILIALILAIPVVAWWALRTTSGQAPATGAASTPAASGTSAARAPSTSKAKPQGDSEKPRDSKRQESATGPCIALEVTAQGVPVPSARVDAALIEEADTGDENEAPDDEEEEPEGPEEDFNPGDYSRVVGPDGRGLGFCVPGKYLLAAHAPGFAPSVLQIVEPISGSPPVARFQLQPGNAVSGHVVDRDSQQPIAGARLTFSPADDFAVDNAYLVLEDLSFTTDARGAFHAADLAAATYRVSVEAAGHSPTEVEVRAPRPEHLSIELEGASRLEGQVIDNTGAPVPGAELWVTPRGIIGEDKTPKTDAQGRFSLEVEPGIHSLLAHSNGLAGRLEREVTAVRGGLVDGLVIRMGPAGSILLRVFAKSSRKPIEGTRVAVIHHESREQRSYTTDASGSLLILNVLPGEYSFSLRDFRGRQHISPEQTVVQPGQQLSVEIAAVSLAALEGHVTDSLGRPAEDAVISVQSLDQPMDEPHRPWAGADELGEYHLTGLAPGRYRVEAKSTPDTTPVVRELTLKEAETVRADFSLPEALGVVQGIVQTTDGSPLHDTTTVTASATEGPQQRLAYVDEDTGQFTLRLMPGTYSLKADYSAAMDSGPEQGVTVEAGKVVQVSLTAPNSVTETQGVVLNSRGEPVPGAIVELSGELVFSSTQADSQGRFTFRTAASTEESAGALQAIGQGEKGEARGVRLGSKHVVVQLLKAAALRGRVVAARGPPVQGFDISVIERKSDEGLEVVGETSPFHDDTFELVDLPPGTLDLLVTTPDGRSGRATVHLASGQTANLEIPVGTLGQVTGRLVTSPGVPRSGFLSLSSATHEFRTAYASRDGRFEFLGVQPGYHVLRRGREERPFTLHEGEKLDVGDVTLAEPSTEEPSTEELSTDEPSTDPP